MFIPLGVGLACIGLLALLGLSATGHLVNEIHSIRRDLTHLAFLQGGLHQELIGKLDDAQSEADWRYQYLSQCCTDTVYHLTGLERYKPYERGEESELIDLEGK